MEIAEKYKFRTNYINPAHTIESGQIHLERKTTEKNNNKSCCLLKTYLLCILKFNTDKKKAAMRLSDVQELLTCIYNAFYLCTFEFWMWCEELELPGMDLLLHWSQLPCYLKGEWNQYWYYWIRTISVEI